MFVKPVKTKSNTQIKSTERKKICVKIGTKFNINENDLNKLFPSKGAMNHLKILAHSGQTVSVYTNDKLPMFFEISRGPDDDMSDQQLFPTVYSLWILPDMVPVFTTHAAVLPRLAAGADLMLPGVIKQGQGLSMYGHHRRDTVVAVNLTSNSSVIGIGSLFRSSEDLYMANNSGICVKMYHVFGDKLWGLEASACLQVPVTKATFPVPSTSLDDFPRLGDDLARTKKESKKKHAIETECNERIAISDSVVEKQIDIIKVEENLSDLALGSEHQPNMPACDISKNMEDEKLKNAFKIAIKRMGKNPTLPLLTSNFYRNHILAVDNTIDLKRTSFKKISKFLQVMSDEKFLVVKGEKGVEKITTINATHHEIAELILNKADIEATGPSTTTTDRDTLFVSEMTELFFVTESTMKFFNEFDVPNGEGVEPSQVKKYVKEYVCNHKLQSPADIRIIQVDAMIAEMCQLPPLIKTLHFDELLSLITSKMKHSYAMRNKNELKTGGKQSSIKMSLATRSGNKKVTLIDNLEMFGIRLPEFAQACKIGVAASTSIIRSDCVANAKRGQLLVQGNQVRFVYKLLTETYKIPSKYINGVELAKKEKKVNRK